MPCSDLRTLDDVTDRAVEGARDLRKGDDRDVVLAPFHIAVVDGVQFGPFGNEFLGKVGGFADAPNRLTDVPLDQRGIDRGRARGVDRGFGGNASAMNPLIVEILPDSARNGLSATGCAFLF